MKINTKTSNMHYYVYWGLWVNFGAASQIEKNAWKSVKFTSVVLKLRRDS